MCALRKMNARWLQRNLSIFGVPVEVVTYTIIPLGAKIGLVEVVPESKNFCELSDDCPQGERHLRVLRALGREPGRLDKLAATTAGYLTMGYALGVRDGHDDNIMLRSDGAFFRVDFGYAFGKTPEIDAPAVFVPGAVAVALGRQRWAEVVSVCEHALQVLSSDDVRNLHLWPGIPLIPGSQPPAWDCLRAVPELGPLLVEARAYTRTLSFEDFGREVRQADQWSFSRAAKNTIREVIRHLTQEKNDEDAPPWFTKAWIGTLDPLGLTSRTTSVD